MVDEAVDINELVDSNATMSSGWRILASNEFVALYTEYMGDLFREQKLYLRYVEQCDRILRRCILFAIFIGAMFFLWAGFFVIVDEFSLLAIAFILGFGVPMLYYNISVAIIHHQFMKSLDGGEGVD